MTVTVDDHGDRELIWKHDDALAFLRHNAPGCRVRITYLPRLSAHSDNRWERCRKFEITSDRVGMHPVSVSDTYSLPFERITMERRLADLLTQIRNRVHALTAGAV